MFTLHGSLAFALVLAAWMYSDVPATNVLAPDRQRVMAALDDLVLLRRLLYAKNVVLWTSFLSHRRGVKMAQRRRTKLLAFLADPARG